MRRPWCLGYAKIVRCRRRFLFKPSQPQNGSPRPRMCWGLDFNPRLQILSPKPNAPNAGFRIWGLGTLDLSCARPCWKSAAAAFKGNWMARRPSRLWKTLPKRQAC